MTLQEVFSKNLHAALYARGMTATDLARSVGISPSIVHRWLNLRNKPSFELVVMVAKELNISIDDLVRGIDE